MQNNAVIVKEGGWKQLESAVFTDNEGTVTPSLNTNTFYVHPAGTEIYIVDNKTVRTFSLTIPHDPDSIGAEIRSFPIPTIDDATPTGISFQKGEFQGTKMFIGGNDSKVMLAYTLPDAYNTDSIVDSPVSTSISAIGGILTNNTFSRDGDFFFTTSVFPVRVHSFPLPTLWDITSNVSSTSFDPVLGGAHGIDFKPEGDKMYLIDITTDEVVEFDLSTVNDLSTAVKTGNVLNFSPDLFQDLKFRSNGSEVIFLTTSGLLQRKHLDEGWDIPTASYFSNQFPIPAGDTHFAISWSPDGFTFMLLEGLGADRNISQYTAPNKFNQTDAVFVDSFPIASFDDNIQSMFWKKNGLRCWIVGTTNNTIFQLNITISWDITSMFDSGISKDLTGDIDLANGLYVRDDGLKLYISDQATEEIFEYDMFPADDITTLLLLHQVIVPGVVNLACVCFKPDGRKLYICDRGGGGSVVKMLNLPTPWNVLVIVQEQSFDVSAQETSVRGIFIREYDGKKLFIVGVDADTVFSYDMSLEFNNAIINNFGDDFINNAGETLVYA